MIRKTQLASLIAAAILTSNTAMADVSINGFATVGIGASNEDASILGYNKKLATSNDSLAAIQFGFQFNDNMSSTLQIIARGVDDWEPEIEWAYVTYEMDQGTLIRAGKLRAPFYMYSDYLDLRYAQPFIRPNTEVYDLTPFNSYTGIDTVVPIELGDHMITIQPFYGATATDMPDGTKLDVSNFVGANATWEWDMLMLRTIYAQGDMNSSSGPSAPLFDEQTGDFIGVGFKIAPGDFFLTGELVKVKMSGALPDTVGGYIGTGYAIGSVTPYLMYGMAETKDNELREGSLQQVMSIERTSISAGVRWSFMPSVAIKADVTKFGDFNDTIGFQPAPGGSNVSPTYSPITDEALVYTLSIDTVF